MKPKMFWQINFYSCKHCILQDDKRGRERESLSHFPLMSLLSSAHTYPSLLFISTFLDAEASLVIVFFHYIYMIQNHPYTEPKE